MRHPHGLLVILLALTVPAPAQAAKWFTVPPPGVARSATGWRDRAELIEATRAVLQQGSDALGLNDIALEPESAFRMERVGTVRFRQHHRGLPVRGASVVVRLGDDGVLLAAVVDVARGLRASAIPAVSIEQARALVGRMVAVDTGQAPATLGFERQEHRGGVLAWYVEVAGAGGLRRWVVDAGRGVVLGQLEMTRDVLGRVYAINPVQTPATSDQVLDGLSPGEPQHLNGYSGRVSLYNYVSGVLGSSRIPLVLEQKTTNNVGDDFLYDPLRVNDTPRDPFAEVNIYYHLGRIREYFIDTLSVDMSASKWSLLAVANYGPYDGYYDNAFFTPWSGAFGAWPGGARNAIFIGNGRASNFGYDSDVFLHEYTHFVNHNAIDFNHGAFDFDEYGTVVTPAAIDEGTADYFSSTVNDEPVVGEASLGSGARDLSLAGPHCPDGLTGESHADGQIVATAAWAIRTALGAAIADKLLWAAMIMLPDSPTFGDIATGILQTAASLKLDAEQIDRIKAALAARGLDDCDRFLAVGPQARSVAVFGLQLVGDALGASCAEVVSNYGFMLTSPFQFQYRPAPDDKAATFHVSLKNHGDARRLSWNLYARSGSAITFGPMGGPADGFDQASEGLTGSSADLVIDASSTPPFDPSATYFLAMAHQNCGTTLASISASNVVVRPDMAVRADMAVSSNDQGTRDQAGGGCSCGLGGHRKRAGQPLAWVFVTAVFLVVLGRRRRADA